MAVNKLDPKVIFASQAPAQDTPAVFQNKEVGWGETRKNGGRPTIKQSNALQQETDLKILWLNENAVTPYDSTLDYPVGAVTLKDGTFKIFNGTSWNIFLSKDSLGLNNVDNTSDLNKPISTATQTALNAKASTSYVDTSLANKTHNSLLDRNVSDAHTTASITDASGLSQQEINKGVFLSDLPLIARPYDGMHVYVKSVVTPNFALAKPFVGDGEFIYASSKSNINDGGVIINGWCRVFDDIQLEYWGARPDCSEDASVALTSAINFITNNRLAINSTENGGLYPLCLNGLYRIDSGEINITQTNGFILKGNSIQSSKLVFTAKSGNFFNISNYQNMTVQDCSIVNASIVMTSGKPVITKYLDSTATAMNFNGTSGGTVFIERSVQYFGWGIVYNTKDATINDDNHIRNGVIWRWNRCVWDNTNVNAVCWTFNNCQAYFNDVVFRNPCNSTMFIGGDYINHGTLFKIDLEGHGDNLTIDGLRIEPYDNTGGSNKVTTIFDISAPVYKMTCRNINMAGLRGDSATKQIGKFKNWFNITFDHCNLVGVFNVDVDTRRNSLTSKFKFVDCMPIPTINQTLFPAIGSYYMNIEQVNQRLTSSSGWINRSYTAQHYGSDMIANAQISMIDQFAITTEAINNSTGTLKTLTIPVMSPYSLVAQRVQVMMTNNTSQTVTYNVYSDAAATVLIGTATSQANKSGKQQVFDIVFTEQKALTSADNTLYIRPNSAANAGLVKSKVNVYLTPAIL